MNSLLRIPYSAAWSAAAKLSAHVPAGDSKLRHFFAGRSGLLARYESWSARFRDPSRKLLWLHAPSVGEGLQALPVLQLLRARRPEVQIAYTYYSPSAAEFARTLGADFCDYLPFDNATDSASAIAALAPSALVYSKLDIWPLLTEEAARHGVSIGVISATLAPGSRRAGSAARRILGDSFRALDAVGAITSADASRFEAQGVAPERIVVTGDTRYDQVWERARRGGELPLVKSLRAERPTLVAGSTWPSDERRLWPAWKALVHRYPAARLILAPHELSGIHLRSLAAAARMAGRSVARIDSAGPDSDVIIVDRMGILGDLYSLADVAYVGGGFHRAGLHSVLEPAAFGAPVLFGPRNSRGVDAAALRDAGGGEQVGDSRSLETALSVFFGSVSARETAGDKAMEFVRRGLGAAERSYDLMTALLDRG